MGDNLLYTYADVSNVDPRWESTLRCGTQVVLFDTGTALDHVLQQAALDVGLQRPPRPGVLLSRARLPALPPNPERRGPALSWPHRRGDRLMSETLAPRPRPGAARARPDATPRARRARLAARRLLRHPPLHGPALPLR